MSTRLLPTTARRGTRPTPDASLVLPFRDALRREYDAAFRNAYVHISGCFRRLPNRAWHEMRRDGTRSIRPHALLLRVVDDACRAGASEEALLELPALLTAYIYARRSARELTPVAGVMAIPATGRRAA